MMNMTNKKTVNLLKMAAVGAGVFAITLLIEPMRDVIWNHGSYTFDFVGSLPDALLFGCAAMIGASIRRK